MLACSHHTRKKMQLEPWDQTKYYDPNIFITYLIKKEKSRMLKNLMIYKTDHFHSLYIDTSMEQVKDK